MSTVRDGKFPIDLIGELVAVQPELPHARIRMPDWQRSLEGVVLAVGPGKPLIDGTHAPMNVKVGDRVTFGAAAGMESVVNGHMIRVMRESDIDMVLE